MRTMLLRGRRLEPPRAGMIAIARSPIGRQPYRAPGAAPRTTKHCRNTAGLPLAVVTALPAFLALPVSALVIFALLRSPTATAFFTRTPEGNRWRLDATPILGGIGIFAGILAGLGLSAARGGFHPPHQLVGIVAGCAVVFLAGLYDDLRYLPPLGKIAAQVVAAGIVIGTGTTVGIL